MRLGLSPSLWRMRSRQIGFTLVEVLVGVTITVTVITTAVAVLSNVMASQSRMLKQTEQAEALRVASAWITRDARLAKACGVIRIPGDTLQLVRTTTPLNYVEYKFYGHDENGLEVPDPGHLHRWEYQGGNLISDDIVGWNMASSEESPGTAFNCPGTGRMAEVVLVARPSPEQSTPLSVTVQALLRSN